MTLLIQAVGGRVAPPCPPNDSTLNLGRSGLSSFRLTSPNLLFLTITQNTIQGKIPAFFLAKHFNCFFEFFYSNWPPQILAP
jgi:hypothetical protein